QSYCVWEADAIQERRDFHHDQEVQGVLGRAQAKGCSRGSECRCFGPQGLQV
ncbi:hypothetical protein LTR66_016150, partial [Elasticomyces elasticus]